MTPERIKELRAWVEKDHRGPPPCLGVPPNLIGCDCALCHWLRPVRSAVPECLDEVERFHRRETEARHTEPPKVDVVLADGREATMQVFPFKEKTERRDTCDVCGEKMTSNGGKCK